MAQKFCTHCGASLKEEQKFCVRCGTQIKFSQTRIQQEKPKQTSASYQAPKQEQSYKQTPVSLVAKPPVNEPVIENNLINSHQEETTNDFSLFRRKKIVLPLILTIVPVILSLINIILGLCQCFAIVYYRVTYRYINIYQALAYNGGLVVLVILTYLILGISVFSFALFIIRKKKYFPKLIPDIAGFQLCIVFGILSLIFNNSLIDANRHSTLIRPAFGLLVVMSVISFVNSLVFAFSIIMSAKTLIKRKKNL